MKIKLIDFGYTHAPLRAHENDAGADVFVQEDVYIAGNTTINIPLGFGLDLPDGYAAFIYPRSGEALRGLTCELPPIDSGYKGQAHAIVTNNSDRPNFISKDERIGQIVIIPIVIAEFINYNIKERGTGAFASTGRGGN